MSSTSESKSKHRNRLLDLQRFITNHYKLEDVRQLAMALSLNYEELGGDTLSGKVRELILYFGRHRDLLALLKMLDETRNELLKKSGFSATEQEAQDLYNYLPGFNSQTSITPFQGPPPPSDYVPRDREEELYQVITDSDHQTILIQGPSGVGKTSLAANLVKRFKTEGIFLDGILWGDMGQNDVPGLLWRFGRSLGLDPGSGTIAKKNLQDWFWDSIAGRHLLLVIDNVNDETDIERGFIRNEIDSRWINCRVLLIAIGGKNLEDRVNYTLKLSPFSESELQQFYSAVFKESLLAQYHDILRDIAKKLHNYPNVIASAARKFVLGEGNPYNYLQGLGQADESVQEIQQALWEAHALNIQGLSQEKIRLLELAAILNSADFSHSMVAAIALQNQFVIQRHLEELVQRGLVQNTENKRYKLNLDLYEYLAHRLTQWNPYELGAAHHLLARYCIDLVHDMTRDLHINLVQSADNVSVIQIQGQLGDETPHFRKIFNWALDQNDWVTLRRFAQYPFFGLLTGVIANSFKTKFTLDMATIKDIYLYHQGQHALFHVQDCIGNQHGLWPKMSVGTYLVGIEGNIINRAPIEGLDRLSADGQNRFYRQTAGRKILTDMIFGSYYHDGRVIYLWREAPARPELELNLRASQIENCQLAQVDLIGILWIAVQAHHLNFKDADLVASRFLGCQLQKTGFFECDARRVDFSGSDFSHAVFRNVDLRGAILHDTIFKEAVLINVDLRGSDLKGADFSNAVLINTNLEGCHLGSAIWEGAAGTPLLSDEDRFYANHHFKAGEIKIERNGDNFQEIAGLSNDPLFVIATRTQFLWFKSYSKSPQVFEEINGRAFIINSTNFEDDVIFQNSLLSGGTVAMTNFEKATLFKNVQMAGARFINVNFNDAVFFSDVSLKGGHFTHSNFKNKAGFQNADLTGITFEHCRFDDAAGFQNTILCLCKMVNVLFQERVKFDGADFSLSEIVNSKFKRNGSFYKTKLTAVTIRNTELPEADFHQSLLEGANFSNVDLIGANFSKSNLCCSSLEEVSLLASNLHEVDLSGGFLKDVELDGANLRKANLSDAILIDVSLTEADLTEANLTNIICTRVNLRQAKIVRAQLKNINLDDVILVGVDLSGFDNLQISRKFKEYQLQFGWGLLPDSLKSDQIYIDFFAKLTSLVISDDEIDVVAINNLLNALPEKKDIFVETLLPILTSEQMTINQDSEFINISQEQPE